MSGKGTVFIQMKLKNGFETDEVKNGYREPQHLPPLPTSPRGLGGSTR